MTLRSVSSHPDAAMMLSFARECREILAKKLRRALGRVRGGFLLRRDGRGLRFRLDHSGGNHDRGLCQQGGPAQFRQREDCSEESSHSTISYSPIPCFL